MFVNGESIVGQQSASKPGASIEELLWFQIRIRSKATSKRELLTKIDIHNHFYSARFLKQLEIPEKGTQGQYGWRESNVNMLTDDNAPHSRELGTTNLRGILCRIYKES